MFSLLEPLKIVLWVFMNLALATGESANSFNAANPRYQGTLESIGTMLRKDARGLAVES